MMRYFRRASDRTMVEKEATVPRTSQPSLIEECEAVSVREAAHRLGRSKTWVYSQLSALTLERVGARSSGPIMISRQSIQTALANRKCRQAVATQTIRLVIDNTK